MDGAADNSVVTTQRHSIAVHVADDDADIVDFVGIHVWAQCRVVSMDRFGISVWRNSNCWLLRQPHDSHRSRS